MVTFKPGGEWPDMRPDAVQVPEILVQWLNKTYEESLFVEIPIEPGDERTNAIIRAARIYCRREGKTLKHEIGGAEENMMLRLKMRDIRPYTRKNTSAPLRKPAP